MRSLVSHLRGWLLCAAAVLIGAADCQGEECTLQLKRLGSAASPYATSRAEYLYRSTYPQSFHMQYYADKRLAEQSRIRISGQEDRDAAFKRIVKKEPAKYTCPNPLRAVIKLGSQEFALVLDSSTWKPEEEPKPKAEAKPAGPKAKPSPKSSLLKSLSQAVAGEAEARLPVPPLQRMRPIGYDLLYFDANHNGDLTDDKVIKPEPMPGLVGQRDYTYVRFPRIDVTIEADGTKIDYAFTMNVNSYSMSQGIGYAYGSVNAAAYREGEITLQGKKRRIVLIDFNSNGRFDDELKIQEVPERERRVYPSYGDVFMLDPESSLPVYLNPYDVTSVANRYNVSKLVNVDGRFYKLKITPAGDKLILEPATVSLGYVTNPNEGFSALLYSEHGVVKIAGAKSKPVPLPEGQWRLLSYTIDRTGAPEPPKPAEKPAAPPKKEAADAKTGQKSLLGAMVKALQGTAETAVGRSYPATDAIRMTRVSAQATGDTKAVVVRKGETVALPFGPPYKPVVSVDSMGGSQVRLNMTLVGLAGEACTDMMIDGRRPPNPEFTISDPKKEIVQRGKFEYG